VQNNSAWKDKKAYVCWLTKGFEAEKARVNTAVVQQFNKRSNMEFVGSLLDKDTDIWSDCEDTPWDKQNIKVGYTSSGKEAASPIGEVKWFDHVDYSFTGRVGNAGIKGATMVLTACNGWRHTKDYAQLKRCQVFVGLHEFGHAAGLAHEHARNDSDCLIEGDRNLPDTKEVGAYELLSVMNYCPHLNYGIFSQTLSYGDLKSLAYLYGSKSGVVKQPRVKDARCKKQPLIDCLDKAGGGKACVTQHCNGGEYHCKNRDELESCAKGQGGLSCLHPGRGDCDG